MTNRLDNGKEWKMRMRSLIVIVVGAIVLLGLGLSGCSDAEQEGKEAGGVESAKAVSMSQGEPMAADDAEATDESGGDSQDRNDLAKVVAGDLGISEDRVREINAEVIALLPKYGLDYDAATEEIIMSNSPLRMQVIDITVVYLLGSMTLGNSGEDSGEDAKDEPPANQGNLGTILQDLYNAGMDMAKAEAAATAAAVEETKPSFTPPAGFSIATRITGSWKSVREEQIDSTASVIHSEAYYDAYVLNSDGTALMRLIRFGEEVKNVDLIYEYDAEAGLLILKTLDRKTISTLRCLTKGDPDLLYLMRDGKNLMIVFERQ